MALPYDALFEIFSFLPAKAILKFTSTSKLFSKFPKNAYFALQQSQNALLRDDTCFFIQPNITQSYNSQVQLHHFLPGEELSSGVSNEILKFFSNSAKILSSSNGLILCRATQQEQVKLFINNPATKSFLSIPIPDHLHNNGISIDVNLSIGFECDSHDGFAIFLFYNNSDDSFSYLDCDVYQSNVGVWKTKKERFFTGPRNLKFDMPVHFNGTVHFISDCFPYIEKESPYFRPYIMSYNFENGKSRMLMVPEDAREGSDDDDCDMRIFKWGKATRANQSICLVRLKKHVFTVWSLTNYESSVWRRVLEVSVKEITSKENDSIIKSFVVLNGDLLVFATEENVYGCGLTDMRTQEICEHGFPEYGVLHFISYSNTLHSCGVGAESLPLVSYDSVHSSGVGN